MRRTIFSDQSREGRRRRAGRVQALHAGNGADDQRGAARLDRQTCLVDLPLDGVEQPDLAHDLGTAVQPCDVRPTHNGGSPRPEPLIEYHGAIPGVGLVGLQRDSGRGRPRVLQRHTQAESPHRRVCHRDEGGRPSDDLGHVSAQDGRPDRVRPLVVEPHDSVGRDHPEARTHRRLVRQRLPETGDHP